MGKQDGLEELIAGSTQFETLYHYNGEVVLNYDDALHAYWEERDGVRFIVPGVTTVTGMVDKSGPLIQWSANMTSAWLRQKLLTTEYCFPLLAGDADSVLIRTVEDLDKLLNEARFNYRTVVNDAADVGHEAHAWLEKYIKGYMNTGLWPISTPRPTEPRASNCVQAALDWLAKHKFRPLQSEKKIFSKHYGYAGTLDWIAAIMGCGEPTCCPFMGTVRALGDFKSSKYHYDEHSLQTAAYQVAWEEEFPDQPIGVRVILRLGKDDGEFDPKVLTFEQLDTDFDGFLGALQVYTWKKQLDLNNKADRAEARAVKKAAKDAAKAEKKPRKAPRRAVIKHHEPIPVGAI